jgi:hypothetical protein
MRAVEKGDAPNVYTQHRAARNDLTGVIGWYCSYCEMGVRNMIEVEHIVPQANGGAPLDWENFLLSCRYCNGCKGNDNQDRDGYLWPDRDNTDMVFDYNEATVMHPMPGTGVEVEAAATIDLMKLARYTAGLNRPTIADTRETARLDAWQSAKKVLSIYQNNPSLEKAKLIGTVAKWAGFYSIWMTVFAGIDDVKAQIVANFKGTYTTAVGGVRIVRDGAVI